MSIVEAEQQAAPVSVTVNVGGKDVTFETGKLVSSIETPATFVSADEHFDTVIALAPPLANAFAAAPEAT